MSLRIGSLVIGGNGDVSTKANLTDPIFPNTVTATGGFIGNLTGNASTATKAKNIPTTDEGGNIWIDGTIIDTTYTTGINTASTAEQCTGNSATASKWATARTLALIGAVTGSVSIDGSGNVNLNTTMGDTGDTYDLAHLIATNGYQKLSNGLILQWGSITGITTTDGTSAVTFPIAFPNSVFIIVTSHVANASTGSAISTTNIKSDYSTTGFTMIQDTAGSSAIKEMWFAIGY